jgi:hypothetical protein
MIALRHRMPVIVHAAANGGDGQLVASCGAPAPCELSCRGHEILRCNRDEAASADYNGNRPNKCTRSGPSANGCAVLRASLWAYRVRAAQPVTVAECAPFGSRRALFHARTNTVVGSDSNASECVGPTVDRERPSPYESAVIAWKVIARTNPSGLDRARSDGV